jgi:prevent-host-death family protein
MTMAEWQIQKAKAHFSELVESAQTEGPQTITKHGKPRAVVVSAEEYAVLQANKRKPRRDFVDFLMNAGPKFDDFEIEREKDTGRDVDLP